MHQCLVTRATTFNYQICYIFSIFGKFFAVTNGDMDNRSVTVYRHFLAYSKDYIKAFSGDGLFIWITREVEIIEQFVEPQYSFLSLVASHDERFFPSPFPVRGHRDRTWENLN